MQRPSPNWLVRLCLGGACFAAASFFLVLLPIFRAPAERGLFWLRAVVIMTPWVAGSAVSWWAEGQFKKTLGAGFWTEEELAPVRRFLNKPLWVAVMLVALVGMFVVMAAWWEHLSRAIFLFVLAQPAGSASRLRQMLVARDGSRVGGLLDLQGVRPMRSEHWGESPRV